MSNFGFGGNNAHMILEEWTGSADHLDPVADRWARRRASQLGIDGPTFDRFRPPT